MEEKDNLYCYEQLCENCSNLVILELIELRSWKEKARPFLTYALSSLKAEGSQQSFKELTELLGGDDDRNN